MIVALVRSAQPSHAERHHSKSVRVVSCGERGGERSGERSGAMSGAMSTTAQPSVFYCSGQPLMRPALRHLDSFPWTSRCSVARSGAPRLERHLILLFFPINTLCGRVERSVPAASQRRPRASGSIPAASQRCPQPQGGCCSYGIVGLGRGLVPTYVISTSYPNHTRFSQSMPNIWSGVQHGCPATVVAPLNVSPLVAHADQPAR